MTHADGRPVAYIDATGIAVFTSQQNDGTHVSDICVRDDSASGQLRLLLDRQPVLDTPSSDRKGPATQTAGPPATGDEPGSCVALDLAAGSGTG